MDPETEIALSMLYLSGANSNWDHVMPPASMSVLEQSLQHHASLVTAGNTPEALSDQTLTEYIAETLVYNKTLDQVADDIALILYLPLRCDQVMAFSSYILEQTRRLNRVLGRDSRAFDDLADFEPATLEQLLDLGKFPSPLTPGTVSKYFENINIPDPAMYYEERIMGIRENMRWMLVAEIIKQCYQIRRMNSHYHEIERLHQICMEEDPGLRLGLDLFVAIEQGNTLREDYIGRAKELQEAWKKTEDGLVVKARREMAELDPMKGLIDLVGQGFLEKQQQVDVDLEVMGDQFGGMALDRQEVENIEQLLEGVIF